MQEYSSSEDTGDSLAMLADYADYMIKFTETMEQFSELENTDLSDEELVYYTEVSLRITKKLAEVAQ